MTYPPIHVLRHGETEWNRDGRLQGHLDSPLTAQGVDQAKAQNAILSRDAPTGAQVMCSDSGRCVETARLALHGLGLAPRYDPRLREVGLGVWQGLTLEEIERDWGFLIEDRDPFEWKFEAPGGESLPDVTRRALAVLDGLTGPTIIFTHGLTSRILRCLALGMPPTELGALPGGQGVVHVIKDGRAETLRA